MNTPEIPGVEILDEVGRGGFSLVYRARQPAFGRIVAAKVLVLDPSDHDVVRGFLEEARNIGELAARPDVVTVYETGLAADGRPYLLLQYLPGGSVGDRLRNDGPLPLPDVMLIGSTIADVLVAAHGSGILHCDLKPANVLYDADRRPVLADFGIARASAAVDRSRSMAFLTPDHAAPELWEGEPPSAATDLYALGSMLYQLLLGRAPFQSQEGSQLAPLQVMRRVLGEDPTPIVRPDVPAELRDLIMALLSKDSSARPSSAAEVEAALATLGGSDGRASWGTTGPTTSSRWARPGIAPSTDPTGPAAASGGSAATSLSRADAQPAIPVDDRTSRRADRGLAPPPIVEVGATAPDGAPPSAPSEAPAGFPTGLESEPNNRRLAVMLGGAVLVAAAAVATLLWWFVASRDDARGRGGWETTTTTATTLPPGVALNGDVQVEADGVRVMSGVLDGSTRIPAVYVRVLDGDAAPDATGLQPWLGTAILTPTDELNKVVATADAQGQKLTLVFSKYRTATGGAEVALPVDRRLCFAATTDPTAGDLASQVCDPLP